MKSKSLVLLLLLFAVFLAGTYSYTLDTKLDLNGDNATYITLARNMASGLGYADTGVNGVTHVNNFPPGYSAILSIPIRLGLDNLLFFKILNALFLYASLCLLFIALAHETKQRYLMAATTLLICCATQLLHFAGMAMSEMSYMFFTVLSVFCLWKYAEGKAPFFRSPWFWIALVSAMASYHIRTVGMALIVAIVIFFLFRREWLGALTSAVTMALLTVPWTLRCKHYGLSSRYLDIVMTVNPWRPEEGNISSVGEFIQKMITNLDQTVIKGFPHVLFPFSGPETSDPSGVAGIILGVIVLAFVIFGAWKTGKLRFLMLALLIGNIGLFALWHGGNGARYVTPIIPFLYYFFYNGVFQLLNLLLKRSIPDHSYLGWIAAAMVLLTIAPLKQMRQDSRRPYPGAFQNYFHMAEEMNAQLPKGSVVCCRKPELFRFHAPDLFTTNYLFDPDPDKVISQMVSQKVDFVIFEQLGYGSTPRYLLPAIQAQPELFPIVWQLPEPDTYLLQFRRDLAQQKGYPTN